MWGERDFWCAWLPFCGAGKTFGAPGYTFGGRARLLVSPGYTFRGTVRLLVRLDTLLGGRQDICSSPVTLGVLTSSHMDRSWTNELTKPYMSAFLSVDLFTDFAAFCLTDL